LAANTAYNGFPLLGSILAQDRYLPPARGCGAGAWRSSLPGTAAAWTVGVLVSRRGVRGSR
ncbi:hypothetical protein, partial [Streptomyces sp. NPDC096068]|uniref:hypothetical protein n=1 Tax=Streptomyces sp. NPDC096068 TaxID=3155424 RepID=UPI00332D5BFA